MLRMMEEQQRRIRIEHEDADPDIRICVERETAPETMLTKDCLLYTSSTLKKNIMATKS